MSTVSYTIVYSHRKDELTTTKLINHLSDNNIWATETKLSIIILGKQH